MQSGTRRVRTIYSVIASPNRLEILRILNTKGPLSYSELKTLAGFRSKKESGKFAYHLRKLVRQTLITLNRAERRYIVTNLGRLVLNLTRQIEEQSIMESGKLYVRTSSMSMEEFNSDKILQSLVKEAGMPVELAQKITSETEARLQKFQTSYLTSPLIREIVNALLIEHGYEEYRHRLTRLGLPIYDVTELINGSGGPFNGIENVISQTAQAVFSEYLLLGQLPRDVTDAHLAGDIHISNTGTWGLVPDTVFMNLNMLQEPGMSIRGKLMSTSRLPKPETLEEAIVSLVKLTSIISNEVSSEIVLENFIEYFGNYTSSRSDEEITKTITNGLFLMPSNIGHTPGRPITTIRIGNQNLESGEGYRIANAALNAYVIYVENTPIPKIKLVVDIDSSSDKELSKTIARIINSGGHVAISSKRETTRSYSGLERNISELGRESDWTGILHSLSLNLPRLSYDSSSDETYFRAKLAILLQLSVSALEARRKILMDMMKKNLLPGLTSTTDLTSMEYMPLVINLVGLKNAINTLVGEKANSSARKTVIQKIIETSVKVTSDNASKVGEIAGVAIIEEDSEKRFAKLDSSKYGKSVAAFDHNEYSYGQIPLMNIDDLSNHNYVEEERWLFQNLNGGYFTKIQVPQGEDEDGIVKIIEKASGKLGFFKLAREVVVCRNCGMKYHTQSKKCNKCRSSSTVQYSTA